MTTHAKARAAGAPAEPRAIDIPTCESRSTVGHVHPGLAGAADARDVFMTAEQVHAYLGLGRTKGYEVTGTAAFTAIAFMPGRWRLADVRALLDARAAAALASMGELAIEPDEPTETLVDAARAASPVATVRPQKPGGRSMRTRSADTTRRAS